MFPWTDLPSRALFRSTELIRYRIMRKGKGEQWSETSCLYIILFPQFLSCPHLPDFSHISRARSGSRDTCHANATAIPRNQATDKVFFSLPISTHLVPRYMNQATSAMSTSVVKNINQYYNVFKVKYHLAMQDPDEPQTRYHTILFVEKDPSPAGNGGGYIHNVTGDLTSPSGMYYETKYEHSRPETCETFHRKEFLGRVRAVDYHASAVDEICRARPPPQRQKAFNPRTMRTEACRPDGEFYSDLGEMRPPYFKCTEWTEEKVIRALYRVGVVQR